jgi:hypothetical protein
MDKADVFGSIMEDFVTESQKAYGSYAHATGTLQSTVRFMFGYLPESNQEMFLRLMRQAFEAARDENLRSNAK